jgi:signal transduction histidine kinase
MSMPEPTLIFVATSAAFAAFVVFLALRTRTRLARVAHEAAAQERQRLARELHDGLTQELAFISLQARQLSQGRGDETLDHLADAAGRALGESRELISALRSPRDERWGIEIANTAQRLAKRHGVMLRLDVDPRFMADPETGRHLLRILREALSNSFVHGRPNTVTVKLEGGERARLRVSDDGAGFEPGATRGGGFGLESMRERAREVGADLLLRSHPGAGTEVEVVFP